MIASADDRHGDHVVSCEGGRRPNVLRAAAVYGANGHGKSNLVMAAVALRALVAEGRWTGKPFKLAPDPHARPSKIVVEFRHGGFDYEYGVAVLRKVVVEEWLFRTDMQGKEDNLFERTTTGSEGSYETLVKSGPTLRRSSSPTPDVKMETFLRVFSSGLSENRTFLAEGVERKIELLRPAHHWICSVLTPVQANSRYSTLYERAKEEEEFRCLLEGFLTKCDVGIETITSEAVEVNSAMTGKLPDSIAKQIETLGSDSTITIGGPDGAIMVIDHDADGNLIIRALKTHRRNKSGELVQFDIEEESSGTQRLMDLAPMLADPEEHPVYIVDELDRKLHPMLAYQFLEAFLRGTDRQMVFTTHNAYLMSLDLLRRDEIWFVQKRNDGSSDIYSLADLKVRPDLNIRKGYLSGRFGAIPFLGNLDDLGWRDECGEPHAA